MIFLFPTTNKINKFKLDEDSIIKNKEVEMEGDNKARVYIGNKKEVREIDVEEYLLGVVSSEMQVNFEKEALKAQAIAARTYYYSKRLNPCSEAQNGEICDSVHCQVYVPKEERLSTWGEKEREANWNKIKEAVEETEGEVLVFHGELVKYPQFFLQVLEKLKIVLMFFSEDVPYLKSTESPGRK